MESFWFMDDDPYKSSQIKPSIDHNPHASWCWNIMCTIICPNVSPGLRVHMPYMEHMGKLVWYRYSFRYQLIIVQRKFANFLQLWPNIPVPVEVLTTPHLQNAFYPTDRRRTLQVAGEAPTSVGSGSFGMLLGISRPHER